MNFHFYHINLWKYRSRESRIVKLSLSCKTNKKHHLSMLVGFLNHKEWFDIAKLENGVCLNHKCSVSWDCNTHSKLIVNRNISGVFYFLFSGRAALRPIAVEAKLESLDVEHNFLETVASSENVWEERKCFLMDKLLTLFIVNLLRVHSPFCAVRQEQ